MKISYDRSMNIVGLGMTPFYRLGPEKWFDNYRIISYLPWNVTDPEAPVVYSLRDKSPDIVLTPENTQAMVRTGEFGQIVEEQGLQDAFFISYRPVEIGYGKVIDEGAKRFTKTYENKVWFRRQYAEKLRLPEHVVLKLRDVAPSSYDSLRDKIGDRIVIQHEKLSGGRGTFFAHDQDSFDESLAKLRAHKKVKDFHRIVFSRALNGPREVSVQACITKHGTLVGPPQQQIVRHPLLVNANSPTADQFCGGVISDTLVDPEMRGEIAQIVQLVAADLARDEYKGIFGIDFLIDETGALYVIEVNARMTGMLPLLTQLQSDYPFLLLHILEKTGAEYELDTDIDLLKPEVTPDGVYLVIHDLQGAAREAQNQMQSGQYGLDGSFVAQRLGAPEQGVAIHSYVRDGDPIEADRRIGAMYMRNGVDTRNELGGIPPELVKRFHAGGPAK